MYEVFLKDEQETINFGKEFAKRLKGDEVICLLGDLGSGKTTFVKGLAEGLGIREGYQVRSPTFTIVNEYPTQRGRLIHIDLYRVEDFDVEQFVGEGIVVVEWAKNLELCDCIIEFLFEGDGRRVVLKFNKKEVRYGLSG
ncbi:tRNA (adenosine(37)-N6)-threonylcarbamoyltransferase complex ATPase subunit type 1 TsaE [Thermocrinis sp.]|jgi:tRNA threonylcarbamoyladenosine biosynthesis protein TsaE|uniref:tRNA (adenosine(37)-N6)-threonylcarbamoyltransferase complex ATPase subunit type 1 TsaE n=1 Tax=Thermocrinis sp. TaxID=2024383 RepID=UPI00262DD8E1|nr:tRNA (adenosine(37)-N6)-threonylcarbamoyltransferase complex ATPase subunit type 1 TsaE [Thermocrinis sp.]